MHRLFKLEQQPFRSYMRTYLSMEKHLAIII